MNRICNLCNERLFDDDGMDTETVFNYICDGCWEDRMGEFCGHCKKTGLTEPIFWDRYANELTHDADSISFCTEECKEQNRQDSDRVLNEWHEAQKERIIRVPKQDYLQAIQGLTSWRELDMVIDGVERKVEFYAYDEDDPNIVLMKKFWWW
jgi:hypothetical protein